MMDGEDEGRSQKSTSSAGRFVFPPYERPMDLQESNDAPNVANIEIKNGTIVDVRRNKGFTDVLVRYPHPNTNDLLPSSEPNPNVRTLLSMNAENGNPKDIAPAASVAGTSAAETATKSGRAAKQALSKLYWTKGTKRVAVGASAVIGALSIVNLLEDGYAKTQKPGSFYNKFVKPTFEGTSSKPKPSDTK